MKYPLVPSSDASGVVLAAGASVTSLSVGDGVIVLPAPLWASGHLTSATHAAAGDGHTPGVLRRHIVVPASWLARFPKYLTFAEAATLGGAGVTAWNALFGPEGAHIVKAGDTVVTQGTGATSMFAAGFAARAGATVISTTGTDAKAHALKELGVSKVLNYRKDLKWGETVRGLTADGEGVDVVVDVGGAESVGQSLTAIRYGGTVAIIGFLSGDKPWPSILQTLPRASIVRGILAGSREHYEQMVAKLEEWQFHPYIDAQVFGFEEAKDAYAYFESQKHIGKVVIKIAE